MHAGRAVILSVWGWRPSPIMPRPTSNLPNDIQTMTTQTLLSKFGSAIAVLAIMFLPIMGCEQTDLTGYAILFDDLLKADAGLRALVTLSVLCGIGVLLLKRPLHHLIGAIVGALALLAAYLYARISSDGDEMELRYGAFVALAGFAVTLVLSLRQLISSSAVRSVQKKQT